MTASEKRGYIRALRSVARWARKDHELDGLTILPGNVDIAEYCERRARKMERGK